MDESPSYGDIGQEVSRGIKLVYGGDGALFGVLNESHWMALHCVSIHIFSSVNEAYGPEFL